MTQGILMARMVKNLPATQVAQVPFLGLEDPLEKDMTTYSSILAWRIPWTESILMGYIPWSHKELDMTERLTRFTFQKTQTGAL